MPSFDKFQNCYAVPSMVFPNGVHTKDRKAQNGKAIHGWEVFYDWKPSAARQGISSWKTRCFVVGNKTVCRGS